MVSGFHIRELNHDGLGYKCETKMSDYWSLGVARENISKKSIFSISIAFAVF